MIDEWRTGPNSVFATVWTGETWCTKAEDDEPEGNRSREVLESQPQCLPGMTKDHWMVKSTEGDSEWARAHLEPKRRAGCSTRVKRLTSSRRRI